MDCCTIMNNDIHDDHYDCMWRPALKKQLFLFLDIMGVSPLNLNLRGGHSRRLRQYVAKTQDLQPVSVALQRVDLSRLTRRHDHATTIVIGVRSYWLVIFFHPSSSFIHFIHNNSFFLHIFFLFLLVDTPFPHLDCTLSVMLCTAYLAISGGIP